MLFTLQKTNFTTLPPRLIGANLSEGYTKPTYDNEKVGRYYLKIFSLRRNKMTNNLGDLIML